MAVPPCETKVSGRTHDYSPRDVGRRPIPVGRRPIPVCRPAAYALSQPDRSRQGQLNLSCAICHDALWDRRLAGAPILQGHPTGYPLYRLEWQSVGSLQRRLRNCMTGMRAEPFAFGSPEFANVELYLMWRARGLPMETPAVRR